MAKLAGFGFTFFDFFVALDADSMGGSIHSFDHRLMDNGHMTVNALEFQLLDMNAVVDFNIVGILFPLFFNVPMTMHAILIHKFGTCRIFMGQYLTGFRVTIDTGHSGWEIPVGPLLKSGLRNVAMETCARVGHEKMSRKKNKGQPDDDHPRKNTKKKPFLLDKILDKIDDILF